jgi:hypothetical protein
VILALLEESQSEKDPGQKHKTLPKN